MMKLKKYGSIGAMLLLSTTVLAACGSGNSSGSNNQGTTKDTKTLKWYSPSELQTLDQSLSQDVYSSAVIGNSQEGLLSQTKDNEVSPGLAKDYNVSKDGKTYTFNLRDAKWSNGNPITANDFVYGWQRSIDPKTASSTTYLFDHVKNANDIANSKKPVSSLGVQAVNDHQLKVTLSDPQPAFKNIVTMSSFFPQNSKVVKENGNKYATNSDRNVYSGPYKVTGWNGSNDTWTLKKNDNYWNNDNTKIEQINYRVVKNSGTGFNEYQSGGLDYYALDNKTQIDAYKNNPQLVNREQASTSYLQLNENKHPELKNINIRKAMSMIIDREQLTQNIQGTGSTPAKGLSSSGLANKDGKDFADASYEKTANEYNPDEAKRLWSEGLKQVNKKNLSYQLLDSDAGDTKVTDFIQSQLEQLPGLDIETQRVPFKNRIARNQSGDFDITTAAWMADYPDPTTFLDLLTKGNSQNYGGFNNPEYNKLVNKANTTDANNPNARWDDMVQAQKILSNQVGVITLSQKNSPQLTKTNVHDVQHFPTGTSYDFRNAYISKK